MKGRGGWPFINLLPKIPVSRMVPGDIIVFKNALPDLLIYKSEPEASWSITPGTVPKNITIIFYHDGQLKTFCVTTEGRLTYMVKC